MIFLGRTYKKDTPQGTATKAGKQLSKEKAIFTVLKEIVGTDTKAYYIMFKYCPELLGQFQEDRIKTFKDLTDTYACFTEKITEKICEKYLYEETCQKAITWLLKRLHHKRLVELYNLYFDKAKEDVQAFRAFQDFSEKFFAETKENDLSLLLSKIPDKEINPKEPEDLSYTYEE